MINPYAAQEVTRSSQVPEAYHWALRVAERGGLWTACKNGGGEFRLQLSPEARRAESGGRGLSRAGSGVIGVALWSAPLNLATDSPNQPCPPFNFLLSTGEHSKVTTPLSANNGWRKIAGGRYFRCPSFTFSGKRSDRSFCPLHPGCSHFPRSRQ
jgi:hypothetical protein